MGAFTTDIVRRFPKAAPYLERGTEIIKHVSHKMDYVLVLAGMTSFFSEILFPLSLQMNLWLSTMAAAGAAATVMALQRDWIQRGAASITIAFLCLVSAFSFAVYIAKAEFHFYPGGELRNFIAEKFASTNDHINSVDADVTAVNDNVKTVLKLLTPDKRAQIVQLGFAMRISLPVLVMLQSQTTQFTVGLTPARLDAILAQKAGEYSALQLQLTQTVLDDPRAHDLVVAAKGDLDRADFQGASAKIRQAAQMEKSASDRLMAEARRRSLEAARWFQRSAEIAQLSFQYRTAAEDFATAAKLAAPYDSHLAWQFTTSRADALYRQGDERGDGVAVSDAADVYSQALTMVSPSRDSGDWTKNRERLGMAVERLQQRGDRTERHGGALRAYRDAAGGRTRDAFDRRSRDETQAPRWANAVDEQKPAAQRTARTAMPRQRRNQMLAMPSSREAAPPLPAASEPRASGTDEDGGGFFSRIKNWVGRNASGQEPQVSTPQQAVTTATERATTQRSRFQGNTSEPRRAERAKPASTGERKSPAMEKRHHGQVQN